MCVLRISNFLIILQMWTTVTSSLRPNILFIMADDMGYQDAGFRGSNIPTPNIDMLARSGVILQHHYVMPQCSPTRASFMTGKSPIKLGTWFGNLKPGEIGGLDITQRTVAEMMGGNGYRTHAVGKWHLGMSSVNHTPVSRGFETFLGMYLGSGGYFTHLNSNGFDLRYNYRTDNGLILDKLLTDHKETYSTEIYTNRTLDIIEEHSRTESQPFFIYLAYQTPHGPYQVPQKYRDSLPESFKNDTSSAKARLTYAAMIGCMDEGIGRIYDRLKELEILKSTLIVFTSDNGAVLEGPGSNFPLRGGKKKYYEGGIRALSFVHSPLLNKTGYVNKNLHHITDWYPTFEFLASGRKQSDGKRRNRRSKRKSKRGKSNAEGVNIWKSITDGKSCRETILINIQRSDLYDMSTDEDNTTEEDTEADEDDSDAEGDSISEHGNPAVEDGTEVIDEEDEESNMAESEEINGGIKSKIKKKAVPFKAVPFKAVPFKDIVVFIWNSWKLIVGNEKSMYAGWIGKNQDLRSHTANYMEDRLDDTDNVVYLYELKTDPREKRNIALLYPGMVQEMLNKVNRNYWDRVKPIKRPRFSKRGVRNGAWRPWVKSNQIMITFNSTDIDMINAELILNDI